MEVVEPYRYVKVAGQIEFTANVTRRSPQNAAKKKHKIPRIPNCLSLGDPRQVGFLSSLQFVRYIYNNLMTVLCARARACVCRWGVGCSALGTSTLILDDAPVRRFTKSRYRLCRERLWYRSHRRLVVLQAPKAVQTGFCTLGSQ